MAGVHAKAKVQVKMDDSVVEVRIARVLPAWRRSA
jgi:hypothetical protein